MTEQILEYIEIDLDRCSLEYGDAPCTAGAAHGHHPDYSAIFNNDNQSWSPTNSTLTADPGGSIYVGTGADPSLAVSGLTLSGADNPLVVLDIERTAPNGGGGFQGAFRYTTGGHSFDNAYQFLFEDLAVGERRTIEMDMRDPTAGGDDWITSTITALRLDLDVGAGGEWIIHSIVAGKAATGVGKCFKSPRTCQDRVNFTNVPATLRFTRPADYLPRAIDAVPSIVDVSFSPATISLGEDLGQRATLAVTFEDHPDSDAGPGGDPYFDERSYDPYSQGTYWGKFRARHPFLRGRPLRWIRGVVGEALGEMETRHYVLESFDGPTPDGKFSLIAKDVLKLADGDRAQAPRLSNGFLVGDINNSTTSATLSPSGIGDLEYAASGYCNIGGKEICAFTRSGDALTLTRGQFNTTAVAHTAQDRVQQCLYYLTERPADIIADLFETYAGVSGDYIPLEQWQSENDNFLQRVYTALIAEPTPVKTLVSELIEQSGLVLWWDDLSQLIRMQVLRGIATDAARFTERNRLAGSFGVREQPDKRLSQLQIYFGQINPLRRVDEWDNYRSSALIVDQAAELDYGTPAIKTIFSRWIPQGGRSIATRVGDIILGRFRDPPQRFNFSTFRAAGAQEISLGGGYRIEHWNLQDEFGARADFPFQVTRLKPDREKFDVEGEGVNFTQFDPDDLNNRFIVIDTNSQDLNIRSMHDLLYPAFEDDGTGVTVTFIVETGVEVGSSSLATSAIDTGDWPSAIIFNAEIRGILQGKGGNGGKGGNTPAFLVAEPGQDGGPALKVRRALNLAVPGRLAGGGGGGGGGWAGTSESSARHGGGGGGGGGSPPGQPGTGFWEDGVAGTRDTGGRGGFGGDGSRGSAGDPVGDDGGNGGSGGSASGGGGGGGGAPGGDGGNGGKFGGSAAGQNGGGDSGAAIDGDSFVTVAEGESNIFGPRIN